MVRADLDSEREQKEAFDSCWSNIEDLDVFHRDYYIHQYIQSDADSLAQKAGSEGDNALTSALAIRLAHQHLIKADNKVESGFFWACRVATQADWQGQMDAE